MATDTLRPMRWVASLFALGLMMALFHRVTAGAPLEARATLALGFLLLVAYVGGEIARRVRLPRLPGYLLVGFAVGPAWPGPLPREEGDALRVIEEAAGRPTRPRGGGGGAARAPGERCDRVPPPRGQPGGPLGQPVVPAHAAPAAGRRAGRGARARHARRGVIPRRHDGDDERARRPRTRRARTARHYRRQGRRRRPPVRAGARPWQGAHERRRPERRGRRDGHLAATRLRCRLRWAGRRSGWTPGRARHGWLGFISQAGMALGLAQLARRAFPEWGVSLETLIVAMIGVHEVAGPICFRTALVRAGEVTEEKRDAEAPVDGGTAVAARGGL